MPSLEAIRSALAPFVAGGASEVERWRSLAGQTGLGGIGKTQLASAFTFRYGQFFVGPVFWLSSGAGPTPPWITPC